MDDATATIIGILTADMRKAAVKLLAKDIDNVARDISQLQAALSIMQTTDPNYDLLYQVCQDKTRYYMNLTWTYGTAKDGAL